MKLAPETVIGTEGAVPAAIEAGLTDAMVGPLTMNGLAEETAVLEFCTVTLCDPAEASWAVVTAAVSEVVLTYVVTSAVVPMYTVEKPLTKFVPVTVSVTRVPPAAVVVGLSDAMVGP
jgi:hypothetical protein